MKISEIIGIAKSTKAAFKTLKSLVSSSKNKTTSVSASSSKDMLMQYGIQYSISTIKSLADPALALLEADEKYQKAYKVFMTVKPIVQMAARSSGVTFSPGNVAEIAKIALGIVTDTLVQLAVSAFYTVKQMVLNYELEIPIGSTSSKSSITTDEKKVSSTSDVTTALENISNFDSDEEEESTTDLIDCLVEGTGEENIAKDSTGSLYIKGSQDNTGIYYSTDGTNYISSNITVGSWNVLNITDTLWIAASILNNVTTEGYGVKYSEDGKSWTEATLNTSYTYSKTTSETNNRAYESGDTVGTETTTTETIDPITYDTYILSGTKDIVTKITNIDTDNNITELTIETTYNYTRTTTVDFTKISTTYLNYFEDMNAIIVITPNSGKYVSKSDLGKTYDRTLELNIPEEVENTTYSNISEVGS